MKSDRSDSTGNIWAALVWVSGMVSVGVLSLSLAARYFQPWLSADYMYPQLFVEDVFAGKYPMSGWTLSSAPYFFPDLTVLGVLRLFSGSGTVLPAYVVFSYISLALVAGWSLQRVTQTGWTAWLAGVALVDALLLWQPVGDHAHYLWLFGTAGFHGGAVLLGLACVALWFGPPENSLSRGRQLVALLVFVLGLGSDTLFFVQTVLPFGVGLLAQAGWNWRQPRFFSYAKTFLWSGVIIVGVRLALYVNGWFSFSKVIRYLPTPSTVGQATGFFFRDLQAVIFPGGWGLGLIAAVSLVIVAILEWRRRKAGSLPAKGFSPALWFSVGGLITATALPLVTTYWRDANHVRYLLPWLVFPGWAALVCLLPKIASWKPGFKTLILLTVLFGFVSVSALSPIQAARLRWPYSDRLAELDRFLTDRGLHHGFSDYWHAYEMGELSHTGVRLFPLRPDGSASFWNSNAFWFFKAESSALVAPEYTFIICDGLNQTELRLRYGVPSETTTCAGLTIWIYSGAKAHRLTQPVENEVRQFVSGRPGAGQVAPSQRPPF